MSKINPQTWMRASSVRDEDKFFPMIDQTWGRHIIGTSSFESEIEATAYAQAVLDIYYQDCVRRLEQLQLTEM